MKTLNTFTALALLLTVAACGAEPTEADGPAPTLDAGPTDEPNPDAGSTTTKVTAACGHTEVKVEQGQGATVTTTTYYAVFDAGMENIEGAVYCDFEGDPRFLVVLGAVEDTEGCDVHTEVQARAKGDQLLIQCGLSTQTETDEGEVSENGYRYESVTVTIEVAP